MTRYTLDDEVVDAYVEAGRLAKKRLEIAASMVKPDALILDVVESTEQAIRDDGADIAFPVNISLNEAAAHDTASFGDKRVFSKGDVVKVDLGVLIDGYIADTAMTVDLGNHAKLVEASRNALNAAAAMVKPGVRTGEIGAAVQAEIEKLGFLPVSNLTGHGLGYYHLHGIPTFPNVAVSGGTVLEEGMTFAIEPFATTGSGHVTGAPRTEIFSQIGRKPVRLPSAKALLKTIETRKTLPFSRRWYHDKNSEVNIVRMCNEGILTDYPVLRDIQGSFVSQAEHTFIVTEDGCIITTA